MTTSATGRIPGRESDSSGFSLLEMIIVLALIMLFSGFLVVGLGNDKPERLLTRASSEIKAAALRASQMALLHRRDYYVHFVDRSAILSESPVSPAEQLAVAGADSRTIERYPMPDEVKAELQLPGTKEWRNPSGFSWRFRSSGLSDPVLLRYSYDRSFIELNFNVLTARAEEISLFQ